MWVAAPSAAPINVDLPGINLNEDRWMRGSGLGITWMYWLGRHPYHKEPGFLGFERRRSAGGRSQS
jgi:hypothetical protein